jgi:hypothetical protein
MRLRRILPYAGVTLALALVVLGVALWRTLGTAEREGSSPVEPSQPVGRLEPPAARSRAMGLGRPPTELPPGPPPLSAEGIAALDPSRDVQQWVDAVERFRTRLDRFATRPPALANERHHEGEALIALVDALATKKFFLPGQQGQVKSEIARIAYADQPERLMELTNRYDAESLADVAQSLQERQQALEQDSRYEQFKSEEAAYINRMVETLPPGPDRDRAIAAGVDEIHRRIFGGPAGP